MGGILINFFLFNIYTLSFKSLKQADILLLDRNYSNLNLNKFKTIVFDYKKIFFSILLYRFINFYFLIHKRKLKEVYLKTFLENINPKVIIGHHENLSYIFKKNSTQTVKLSYIFIIGYLNLK